MGRVGIIGAGGMGLYVAHLLQQQSNEVHFSDIFDPDERAIGRARKYLGFDGKVHDSDASLLSADCEWVMIASLNAQHADQTVAAFEAGKHVFCQKPLATNLVDCLRMRDAWRASGRRFVIGFTLRFSPHYRRLKQLVESGAIGDILSFEFNETLEFNHGGYINGDWRRFTDNAGSHVLEKCSHDIDIVNWLMGERVTRVASFGGNNFFVPENRCHIDRLQIEGDERVPYRHHQGRIRGEDPFTAEKDIYDNQVVILEFANQARATFHMNSNAGIPERRLYLCGTEGTIRADVLTGKIELQRIGFDTVIEDCSTSVKGMHGGGDEILAEELFTAMQTQSGQPEPCLSAGIEEGLNAAVVCYAIDEAATTGKVVDLANYWAEVDRV